MMDDGMQCSDSCCTVTLLITGQGGRGNFVEIFNTNQGDRRRGLQVSPQGDLTILEARADHAGQYLCHVSNGVGQPLHTIVNVTVKVPPKMLVKDSTKRINAAIKEPQVKLVCTAEGDRPITVKWTKVSSTLNFTLSKENLI